MAHPEMLSPAVGIIDVGSNSVRLVVYGGQLRTPVPLFNEKTVCALGKGLGETGCLNAQGRVLAVNAIGRFIELAKAMAVSRLDILATAAVRDAEDGAAFVAEIHEKYGTQVTILSGEDEAEMAGYGVMCSIPQANGIVADMGGGSLELIEVENGVFGERISVPLGALRLLEASEGDRNKAEAVIDSYLNGISWLQDRTDKNLYVVGGAWRAIARICIDQLNYPIHVLDNFRLEQRRANELIWLIAGMSRRVLERIPGVPKKRLATLPLAAILLGKLLQASNVSNIVFSVYGMREGYFYRNMPELIRSKDPLISSAEALASGAGRFPEHGQEIMDWTAQLFPDENPAQARLRLSACIMSDIFWNEHPDFRAIQAFYRILRMPYVGLEHMDRAGLALAVYYRYKDESTHKDVRSACSLLSDVRFRRVQIIGSAMRLAHTLSGGAPGILAKTELLLENDKLVLKVKEDSPLCDPIFFQRRLEKLGRLLDKDVDIIMG
jgi:exopolyphosphatase/guanosine-5'-triphosphate,3'-diphosphate pyrophosphatase